MQFYVIRRKLLRESTRPKPMAVKSIGIWMHMLGIVPVIATFSNAFYTTIMMFDRISIYTTFLIFVVLLLGGAVIHSLMKRCHRKCFENQDIRKRRLETVRFNLIGSKRAKRDIRLRSDVLKSFKIFGLERYMSNSNREHMHDMMQSNAERRDILVQEANEWNTATTNAKKMIEKLPFDKNIDEKSD